MFRPWFAIPVFLGSIFILQACQSATPVEPVRSTPVAITPNPTPASPANWRMIIWATDEVTDLAAFDRAAAQAKNAGATHMIINENVPRAMWEYGMGLTGEQREWLNRPLQERMLADPYPAWYDYRPSLFKIFTPGALRKYIPQDYARQVAQLLEDRCAILRKHRLQGVFQANEPQVLPEAVFTDHPLWRGPRVDQPSRSKVPHFSACVDEPQVLALYRESIAALRQRCPEITVFRFVTTDAGSGLCWAPGLYPGANGPTHCKGRPLAERVRGFLETLQAGARQAGGNAADIEVRLIQIEPEEWMIPTFPDPAGLARQMPPGIAINNFEAPTASPYLAQVGWTNPALNFFSPLRGIPNPAEILSGLRGATQGRAPRLYISAPRGYDQLYGKLLQEVRRAPPTTAVEEAALLHRLAVSEVGDAHGETLVQVWTALGRAHDDGLVLKFAYPSVFGGVHQRWLIRPFVPFPEELPADQKAYFRPFLLQGKADRQADDLVDMQAMHLFRGWAGRMWILNVYNKVEPEIRRARARLAELAAAVPAKRVEFERLDRKLEAYLLTCANVRNAVNYQAALDYIKTRMRSGAIPDEDPPLGAQPSWDRRMIMDIARAEIDNTAALLKLIEGSEEPLIDTAPRRDQEDITWLGPDLPAQLKRKIDIMNARWKDYDRITTVANP